MTEMWCFVALLSDGVESNHPNPIHPLAHSCLNNEVTSPSWLRPRSKKSIVSITMTKNEDPMLERWMRCPCPANSPNPKSTLPPAPFHIHLTPTLLPAHHSVSLCQPLRGKMKPSLQTELPFHLLLQAQGLLSVIHPCTHSIQIRV